MNFPPGGRDAIEISRAVNEKDNIVSLMDGRVNVTLSAEGGMHRAFHQTVILSTGGMQPLPHQPSTKISMQPHFYLLWKVCSLMPMIHS